MEKYDEIMIETEYLKSIVSRLISNILKKKWEHDMDIHLNKFSIIEEAEKMQLHLDIDAEIRMDELEALLKHLNVI